MSGWRLSYAKRKGRDAWVGIGVRARPLTVAAPACAGLLIPVWCALTRWPTSGRHASPLTISPSVGARFPFRVLTSPRAPSPAMPAPLRLLLAFLTPLHLASPACWEGTILLRDRLLCCFVRPRCDSVWRMCTSWVHCAWVIAGTHEWVHCATAVVTGVLWRT